MLVGGRKGIRPVKNWVVESTIQIGSTFLVPAHIGSPGKGPLNASEVTTLWRYRNLFIIIIIIFF